MDFTQIENSEDYIKALHFLGESMRARSKADQEQKVVNFKTLNRLAKKSQILFTGSSLMEGFPVAEMSLSNGLNGNGKFLIYNRGIGGYTTDDFLREINTVLLDLEPSVVFINIGTNDLRIYEDGSDWLKHLTGNYERILSIAKEKLPETRFYLMAYYPTNHHMPENGYSGELLRVRTNENIDLANEKIKELAEKYNYQYLDLNEGLKDENGELKAEYTIEGIHMYAKGYQVVFDNLRLILEELQA